MCTRGESLLPMAKKRIRRALSGAEQPFPGILADQAMTSRGDHGLTLREHAELGQHALHMAAGGTPRDLHGAREGRGVLAADQPEQRLALARSQIVREPLCLTAWP